MVSIPFCMSGVVHRKKRDRRLFRRSLFFRVMLRVNPAGHRKCIHFLLRLLPIPFVVLPSFRRCRSRRCSEDAVHSCEPACISWSTRTAPRRICLRWLRPRLPPHFWKAPCGKFRSLLFQFSPMWCYPRFLSRCGCAVSCLRTHRWGKLSLLQGEIESAWCCCNLQTARHPPKQGQFPLSVVCS